MRWFGGFSGPAAISRAPAGGRAVWPELPVCWTVGDWAEHEVRATRKGHRSIVVFGSSDITWADLSCLALHGVPDDVAWRWPGGYTVVEVTDDATTIWTDLGGAWPIYVTAADGGVYWSSSSRALAGLTMTGPDVEQLAARLLAPSVPILLDSRSAFTDIQRIPAGHRGTLPAGGPARPWRPVWTPRPRSGSPAARLRDELAAAVALRLGTASTLTVDLSGGYDSTALTLLAANMSRLGREVTGVTVYPVGRPSGGDLDYARMAAERSGILHRLMPLDVEHAPYSRLGAVPVTDEPAPSTIAHARVSGQLEWMRETLGTDCHMTGDGGDSLLCSPPIMLADLVAAGQYRRAWAETLKWARLRRLPPWPLLSSAYRTARTSRTDALRDLAIMLRNGRSQSRTDGDIRWYATDPVPPWATMEACEQAATVAERVAERTAPAPATLFAAITAADSMAEVGRTARADVQLAEFTGVSLHNPFTDSRVIDAYLSIPLAERPGPADYKPILRDALCDLFPAALAARITKGDFNPDHYGGMRANLAELHSLADGRLAALGLVDPAAFRRTLSMTAAGLPVPFSTVEPAVAAEVWLRAVDMAQPVAWSAAQHGRGAV
ncbi:albusnodin/ikarugamycin family macrolactam cyclase [Actinomadura formosensis]|uniref:albusnodin/ikarugamycin family macrolactam cyclase n=1 Tax=Actinomadura formosensis TaxID=60706 RepID=UPI00082C9142|nr:albusnodin/ikarugamycin family macrolactam cyclase [Actinomadura formosensis]